MPTFSYTTTLPFPRADVFAWFARPGALVRLTPSYFGSVIAEPSNGIEVGSTAALGVGAPGGLGMWLGSAAGTVRGVLPAALAGVLRPELRWDAVHTELVPGFSFTDVMAKGPLRSWTHRHDFADGPTPDPAAVGTAAVQSTVMTDTVNYELPGGTGSAWALGKFEAELQRMFAFRERQLQGDLRFHNDHPSPPKTIAVTGASGMLGTQICALLSGGGHRVVKLVRRAPDNSGEIFWDPDAGVLDADGLRECVTVIHLAGHTIGGRFTDQTKKLILQSRTKGTRLLAETLASLGGDGVQRTLVSASAVGYYGAARQGSLPAPDGGPSPLTESDPAGSDFLAQVCQAWEAACQPAAAAGVRVVNVRTGLVLSAGGGVLQRFLPLYLAGVGGPLGSGQWQSWIGIDDIAGIFAHAALSPEIVGPVNGVAPYPVTAEDFASTLGKVLHRPAAVKVPMFGPQLLLGKQGAAELALADQKVSAGKIVASGYGFRHETLETALRHILGAPAAK